MDLMDLLAREGNAALPMHMPGHKRNVALAPYLQKLAADCDITEIDGFDNLHDARGILREGMARTAAMWGSERAFWLVGGSTAGILAAVWASVPDGAKVICARNCHASVYNALTLRRAEPAFLMPELCERTGVFGPLRPQAVAEALREAPDAKLVILTSPTYEGILSDLPAICALAHARGVPVLVDEAHGAHLGFGHGFPDGALRAGADLVVHSLHKTLPSLTQTAALHVQGDLADARALAAALAVFETSSPSYLLMASIDGCTRLLEARGGELFAAWAERLRRFQARAAELRHLRLAPWGWPRDPSKLAICTERCDLSGARLAQLLRERQIEPEMAARYHALAMTGMGDEDAALDALADALTVIDGAARPRESAPVPVPVLPPRALPMWEAAARPRESVRLEEAAGRVCAERIWAYPPGIPLALPGEVLTGPLLALLRDCADMGIRLFREGGDLPVKIGVLRR